MWIAGVCNDCLQILRSRPPKPIAESEYIHGDEHPNVQGPRGLAGWNGFGRQHLRVQRVAPSRRAVRSMCADAPCRSLSSQQRRRGSRVSYGAARLSPAHTDCTGILRGTRDTSRAVSQAVSENRTGARGRREEADSNRPAASWALTRVETNQGSKRRFETPVRRGTPWGSALQGASPRASELPSSRAPERPSSRAKRASELPIRESRASHSHHGNGSSTTCESRFGRVTCGRRSRVAAWACGLPSCQP